jgi:hypothetical protein
MSDEILLGQGRRIVTERMTDGTLGRTLEQWNGSRWCPVKSVAWSAPSRRFVICKDELDKHLRKVAQNL